MPNGNEEGEIKMNEKWTTFSNEDIFRGEPPLFYRITPREGGAYRFGGRCYCHNKIREGRGHRVKRSNNLGFPILYAYNISKTIYLGIII
jgi:hypothetical protein